MWTIAAVSSWPAMAVLRPVRLHGRMAASPQGDHGMKWFDGVFRCSPLGVDDCVVWWDAIAAYASVSAAIGTWVVGFIAGVIALMTYLHRKGEVDAGLLGEFERKRAQHQRWVMDLEAATYARALVHSFEADLLPKILSKRAYRPLVDFFGVCEDSLPVNPLVPDRYVFEESQRVQLFHIEHSLRRVRSCIAICRSRFDASNIEVAAIKDDFRSLKDWVDALHEEVSSFLPTASAMTPKR